MTEDEAVHADWVMTSRDKEGTEFVLKPRSVDFTLVPKRERNGVEGCLVFVGE